MKPITTIIILKLITIIILGTTIIIIRKILLITIAPTALIMEMNITAMKPKTTINFLLLPFFIRIIFLLFIFFRIIIKTIIKIVPMK